MDNFGNESIELSIKHETAAVVTNCIALSRRVVESLYGGSLKRDPEINLEEYIATAVGEELSK